MKRLLHLLVAIAMISSFAFAQTATADIYGTVVLPDGSAIPGVSVTLTGDVIGKKVTVTSEEGNFRFLKLPPGNYELKFELEGFKTVVRKGIRLFVGKNVEMKIQMETSQIKEEVVVSGNAGVVDTRKTTVGVNVTNEMIQALPTARNPWTILNLIPGMMVDREDVGGNESGQQSSFYGHGADSADTTWNVDGANITDPSAIGAAPAYLNVNAYEELQVTLGANDITAQTGGVQLNFVTKRAGNRYSGDFHLYVEDQAWEMKRDVPEFYEDAGYVDPGVFRLYQYGINFGGPIVKDHLWWFGSWAIQDIHSRTIVNSEDATWLVSGYAKLNFQYGNTSGDFHISYDAKKKWGRTVLGAANQDPGTLFDQDGPGYVYVGSLQQILGNLMLTAKVAYTDGGFVLDPRGSDLQDINGVTYNIGADWGFYYTPSRYYGGSMYHYITNRNSLDFAIDGNYFAEGFLGGDHEVRFGFDMYTATTTSQTLYPNGRILFYWSKTSPDLYKEIWWVENGIFDAGFKRTSFYLSDTATFGKLTATLGVRYDKEQGHLNPVTSPGIYWVEQNQYIFTDWVPALTTPDKDAPAAYEVISPRLSLTYDITGDGKNVVKLAVARYGSQSGNDLSWQAWVGGNREIDVGWWDDGDDVVEPGEFSQDPYYWYWWNINTVDPTNTETQNKWDPNFNSPLLDELTLSFEKALSDDLAVGVSLFYKKKHNLTRGIGIMDANGTLETKDNWYYAGDYTFSNGHTQPYYLRYTKPAYGTYYTNYDKAYNRYMAAQITLTKNLSNNWMMNASFTYSDWRAIRYEEETFDMTNFEYWNEGVVAPGSGGSGLSGIYVNSRWMFKLSGLYQLPYGINITGVLTAREGYVIPYHEYVYRSGGLGWTNLYEYKDGVKFGDDRLPTFYMLNLGLEKSFKISDTATATIFVDGYNITNNDVALKVNDTLGTETTDRVERVLNKGLFQFGIRVNF